MTPAKQLFQHDPGNGVIGDCYRTAVACLLDLPPADVPHSHAEETNDEQRKRTRAWLSDRGLSLVTVEFGEGSSIDQTLRYMAVVNPGIFYMLSGRSPRGTNHVVIAKGGEIIHDPAIEGGGLVGPLDTDQISVEFLVPAGIHVA